MAAAANPNPNIFFSSHSFFFGTVPAKEQVSRPSRHRAPGTMTGLFSSLEIHYRAIIQGVKALSFADGDA